ncbi:hypothetical protein PPERSA_01598 [Pseudocohnilembus persalinus]|uniref:PH domain-containing protein n=1 Tax=Pseudocohnilembus persalinus TaxID=266149 RepID=A0A0V0QI51_PSEPJ|nr:hypothetical protein PPERSA_01598 [Pseudocohnilembus persalinus]|eukprot:KRX01728.1 hypothetical protein PPERSA_01598 [Pseudocohnilembus persalinus]
MTKQKIVPFQDDKLTIYLSENDQDMKITIQITQNTKLLDIFPQIYQQLGIKADIEKFNQDQDPKYLQKQAQVQDNQINQNFFEKGQSGNSLLAKTKIIAIPNEGAKGASKEDIYRISQSELNLENPLKSNMDLVLFVYGGVIKKNYVMSKRVVHLQENLFNLIWKRPAYLNDHLVYTVEKEKIKKKMQEQLIQNINKQQKYENKALEEQEYQIKKKYIFLQNAEVRIYAQQEQKAKNKQLFSLKSGNQYFILMAQSQTDLQGWFNILYQQIKLLNSQWEMENQDMNIQQNLHESDNLYIDYILKNYSDFIYLLQERQSSLIKLLFYLKMNVIDKQLDKFLIETLSQFYKIQNPSKMYMPQFVKHRAENNRVSQIQNIVLKYNPNSLENEDLDQFDDISGDFNWDMQQEETKIQTINLIKKIIQKLLDYISTKERKQINRQRYFNLLQQDQLQTFYKYIDVKQLKNLLKNYLEKMPKTESQIKKEQKKKEQEKTQQYIYNRMSTLSTSCNQQKLDLNEIFKKKKTFQKQSTLRQLITHQILEEDEDEIQEQSSQTQEQYKEDYFQQEILQNKKNKQMALNSEWDDKNRNIQKNKNMFSNLDYQQQKQQKNKKKKESKGNFFIQREQFNARFSYIEQSNGFLGASQILSSNISIDDNKNEQEMEQTNIINKNNFSENENIQEKNQEFQESDQYIIQQKCVDIEQLKQTQEFFDEQNKFYKSNNSGESSTFKEQQISRIIDDQDLKNSGQINFQSYTENDLQSQYKQNGKKVDESEDKQSQEQKDEIQNQRFFQESEIIIRITTQYLEEKYLNQFVRHSDITKQMEEIPVKSYRNNVEDINIQSFLSELYDSPYKQNNNYNCQIQNFELKNKSRKKGNGNDLLNKDNKQSFRSTFEYKDQDLCFLNREKVQTVPQNNQSLQQQVIYFNEQNQASEFDNDDDIKVLHILEKNGDQQSQLIYL